MEREIKFRAWSGTEMYNVDVLAISKCTWACPDFGKRGVSLAYQPSIKVMQFAGSKDKNGREIYEGDIVQHSTGEKCEIIFYGGAFCYKYIDTEEGGRTKYMGNHTAQYTTVIGNIYEKP